MFTRSLFLLAVFGGCGQITLATDDDMQMSVDDMPAFMGDMAGMDGPTGPVVPAIRANPDFVGFPTRLDATASTDSKSRALTFGWHFTQVPIGSKVADACAPTGGFATCLTDAAAATPSFEPDFGGDYEVELTVTAGSDVAKLRMTFTVPTESLFVSYGHVDVTVDTGITVIRSDGRAPRDVTCRLKADGGLGSNGSNTQAVLFNWIFNGIYGLSATQGGAVGTNAFSFLVLDGSDGGGVAAGRLYAGDETSDCTNKPAVRIDDPASPAGYIPVFPTFSPNGKRIMYIEVPPDFSASSPILTTVAPDGTNRHVISTSPQQFFDARPIWLDNGNVAWVENNGTEMMPMFVINSHADVAGGPFSGLTPLVDCSNATATANSVTDKLYTIEGIGVSSLSPLTLVLAGSNEVFVKQNQPGPQTIDLYRVTTGTCHLDNITKNPPHGWARDFVITPDGKTVVYASTVGNDLDATSDKQNTDLWTVPVDGASAAKFLVGDLRLNDIGPHLIAGGRQVAWTQTTIPNGLKEDGGFYGDGLSVVNLDGTHHRSLLRESGNTDAATGVLGGFNLGAVQCSVAGDQLGDALRALFGGAAAAILLVVLVLMKRRRPV